MVISDHFDYRRGWNADALNHRLCPIYPPLNRLHFKHTIAGYIGYITGCKITQKDIEWAERSENNQSSEQNANHDRLSFRGYIPVIYYSIFVRSAYLFFLVIGFLVLQFSVSGVVVALFGIILDYFLLISHAKKVERSLPFDYLQRAGQLSIFGYNVLPDQLEEDDVHLNLGGPDAANNHQIHVTTASMRQYSANSNLDEPMVVGAYQHGAKDGYVVVVSVSNDEENDAALHCEENNERESVELHVRDEMLEETNSNSENDDHAQPTVR